MDSPAMNAGRAALAQIRQRKKDDDHKWFDTQGFCCRVGLDCCHLKKDDDEKKDDDKKDDDKKTEAGTKTNTTANGTANASSSSGCFAGSSVVQTPDGNAFFKIDF